VTKDNCEHPELRPKDGKCGEELIRQCHGDQSKHPCNCNDNKQKD
jgi:hypothetical protein